MAVFVDVAVRFGDPEVARRVDRQRGEFVAFVRAQFPEEAARRGERPDRPVALAGEDEDDPVAGLVGGVDGDVVAAGAEVEGPRWARVDAELAVVDAARVEAQNLVVAGVDRVDVGGGAAVGDREAFGRELGQPRRQN